MHANVRRYVALAQSRGGACFCTRDAMQGYAVITLFSRWQKPCLTGVSQAGVTPAWAPGGAGAACAAGHKTVLFSQKVLAAQKPMTYTDLLALVNLFFIY